ncbi:rod shape-determining protein MreD [Clostridium merdae]|uniref:rod shape-determining protein MreD n=1 Tax=Clostridium merdae TaxID=1958780 RepID=UPI000A2713BA|nr:rod shape-determining protein MreD [Clostridium merdae]
MIDKRKLLRYFAYTIEIVVIYLINQTPGLIPPVFGARPVLLLPVAICIALFESETAAMGFGLMCGALLDFGMSGGSSLGFHTLLLSVFCYCAGLMAVHLLRANLLTAFLLSTAVVAFIFTLQWLFYYVFVGYQYPGVALVSHYLPRFVYTLLPVPLIYAFNRAFALNIRESAG